MIQPKKQAKWRSLVSEQEESGQRVAAFCRARGLSESLFHYWKKRLKQAAPPAVRGSTSGEVALEVETFPLRAGISD
jgi:hypothetical protein